MAIDLSWENPFPTFPKMLEALNEINWFAGFSEAERAERIDELETAFAKNPRSAFFSLRTGAFDTECISGEGDYVAMIEFFAGCSAGKFDPRDIRDEFDYEDRETALVSFTQDGREYSGSVAIDGDWFQFEVLELVNRALGESGAEERFIVLPGRDQTAELVFIAPAVYENAVQKGIIPKGDGFIDNL